MDTCVSKKIDFVSNPTGPKWPFLKKIGPFGNLAAAPCILANNFTLEMSGEYKIAHFKVVFRMG